MSEWFRSWHGAPTDTKWTVISRKSGAPLSAVIALAWVLMDAASQSPNRGSIEGSDPELLAVALDIDEEVVCAILAAMREKERFISKDDRLAAWDKRQPRYEDVTAAERKRRQRENERVGAAHPLPEGHAGSDPPPVTYRDIPGHTVTDRDGTVCHDRVEQSRVEENRREKESVVAREPSRHGMSRAVTPRDDALWHEVGQTVLTMLNRHGDPTWNYGIVAQWIADGCDAERHIYPTIRRLTAEGRSLKANNLSYFTKAIMDARQKAPAMNGKKADPIEIQRKMRVDAFLETGFWQDAWGSKPEIPPQAPH